MRHLFMLAVSLTVSTIVFGQDAVVPMTGPIISWENTNYDFGDLKQGDRVESTFRFTNMGTAPLIITNVEVTCGCTTPKGWPKDPILPGAKGELTVAFNSVGKYGRQNKVIKIISNSVGKQNQVMFTANVLVKE